MQNDSDTEIRKSETPQPTGHIPIIPPVAKEATKRSILDLGRLIGRYARIYLPESSHPEVDSPVPPQLTGSHAGILKYLRIIPILLFLAFVASFFWDTADHTVEFAGTGLVLQAGLDDALTVELARVSRVGPDAHLTWHVEHGAPPEVPCSPDS